MANNLIISYDLNSPGQDYDRIIEKIKTLGNWAKMQKSVWYVSSNLSAKAAVDEIHAVMDNNDSLTVIDTTNDNIYWYGLNEEVIQQIQNNWHQ